MSHYQAIRQIMLELLFIMYDRINQLKTATKHLNVVLWPSCTAKSPKILRFAVEPRKQHQQSVIKTRSWSKQLPSSQEQYENINMHELGLNDQKINYS